MLIAVGNSINGGTGSGTGAGGGGGGSPRTAPILQLEPNPEGRIPQLSRILFGSDSTFPFSVFVGEDPELVISNSSDAVDTTLNSGDSFGVKFSSGARFSIDAGSFNIRRVLRLDNIIVNPFFSGSFTDKDFSNITTLPAAFTTSLQRAMEDATGLPSNIGSGDVSKVDNFAACFKGVTLSAMSDAFGNWTFKDAAVFGLEAFSTIGAANLSSCLIQWEANTSQGVGVDATNFPFEINPRQGSGIITMSETTYPAAKAAYDNLIANNNWSFGTSINWVA